MAFYVDTSALVKLVIGERESLAMHEWAAATERRPMSSDLVRAELTRSIRRAGSERLVAAREVLDGLDLIAAPRWLFDAAGRLDPVELHTLDALHLASALVLGDELEGIVTYDERLASAARASGIAVIAPS